jgi:hypothetical protein
MEAQPSTPRKRGLVVICLATIPLSLWCFHLANHAIFPSRRIRKTWGPQLRTKQEHTSAPDYMEWDLVTMALMLFVCALATTGLVVAFARRRRSPDRG